MDKEKVVSAVLKELEKKRDDLSKNYLDYQKAANEAPSFMESASDSSKSQFSTIARNISAQIKVVDSVINFFQSLGSQKFDSVQIGSLVLVNDNGGEKYFFLVPEDGGGITIKLEKREIQTVSSESVLGKILLNKKIDQDVILPNNKIFKVVSAA